MNWTNFLGNLNFDEIANTFCMCIILKIIGTELLGMIPLNMKRNKSSNFKKVELCSGKISWNKNGFLLGFELWIFVFYGTSWILKMNLTEKEKNQNNWIELLSIWKYVFLCTFFDKWYKSSAFWLKNVSVFFLIEFMYIIEVL